MSRLKFDPVSSEDAVGIFIYQKTTGPISKRRAQCILIDSNVEFFFEMIPHSENGELSKCPKMKPEFSLHSDYDRTKHNIFGFSDDYIGWYIRFDDIHMDIVEFANLFSSSAELTSYIKLIPNIELNILIWTGIKELYKAMRSYKELDQLNCVEDIEYIARLRRFEKVNKALDFIGQATGTTIDYPQECVEFIEKFTKPKDDEESIDHFEKDEESLPDTTCGQKEN